MSHKGINQLAANQESLLSIFPNPCLGDTYLYTDDPDAEFVSICNSDGEMILRETIVPGRSLYMVLNLAPGTYYLELKDRNLNHLGLPRLLQIVK